ncbi:MAG: hypothetical protein WAV54_03585 [Acidimicrobiales bacterium]
MGVCDLDVPTQKLKTVMDEPGASRQLDRRDHRLSEGAYLADELAQSTSVWRRGRQHDSVAVFIEDIDIEALPAQIQASVQYDVETSFGLVPAPKFSPEEIALHDIH